ncbi:autotransporter outer membrane beta-barrel domain-containing protein, partial [Campylobacter jejuni]
QARINTTVSGSISNQINITDQGPHTIIIGAGGTLGNENNNNKIIYAHASGSNTLTLTNLTNKGTINGNVNVEHDQGFTGTITVNTFENTGQVNGQIYMGVWGGNSGTLNIDKFDNSGTITSSSDKGTVFFEGNTNIQTFTNTGTIKNTGNTEPSEYENLSSGVYLSDSSAIKTFINKGLISGIIGVNLMEATIENFTNQGTIESTSSNKNAAAIILRTFYTASSVINKFSNEGIIKSKSNGILAEANNKIHTLINKGSIEAELNGISFYDAPDEGSINNKMELGKIILEAGSSIKAGNNGINIDSPSKPVISDAIEVKQGAKVEGGKSGIYIGGGKEINTQITIAGEVSGGAAGIVNEGIIGGSSDNDDKKGGIIISGGSVSSSSGGSGIV